MPRSIDARSTPSRQLLISALRYSRLVSLSALLLLFSTGALAGKLNLPPEAREALRLIYSGDPGAAIEASRKMERQAPDHPLGYLLEANARWWEIYCDSLEVKWNLIDAWHRPKLPEDDSYFALGDKAAQLAEHHLQVAESAEMHVYLGMAWALKARLHGLRGEHRLTAREGVKARAQFLRAVELDPDMADAYTGIGLYNYLADALSSLTKMLRFFIGIPGGNKKEGIRQLEIGMNQGELTATEARFYLAKNLRNYEKQYQRGAELITPLASQFPKNAIFLLFLGDLHTRLSQNERAAALFHSAEEITVGKPSCRARTESVARAALGMLKRPSTAQQ